MYVTYGPKGWGSSKASVNLGEQERNIFALNLKLFVPLEELMAPKVLGAMQGDESRLARGNHDAQSERAPIQFRPRSGE
jgi:hypothetical protein